MAFDHLCIQSVFLVLQLERLYFLCWSVLRGYNIEYNAYSKEWVINFSIYILLSDFSRGTHWMLLLLLRHPLLFYIRTHVGRIHLGPYEATEFSKVLRLSHGDIEPGE